VTLEDWAGGGEDKNPRLKDMVVRKQEAGPGDIEHLDRKLHSVRPERCK
jgi:hypothetical protein